MHDLSVVVSFFVVLLALAILALRLRLVVTPFHLCAAAFAAELVFVLSPQMVDDEYGRTHVSELLVPTRIIILGAAFTILACSIFIKRPKGFHLPSLYEVETRFPRNILVLGLLGVVLVASAVTYRNLGGFPLFVMGQGTQDAQLHYNDVYSGFLTFVGWGAARTLVYWLILEVALVRKVGLSFLQKNGVLAIATGFALFCNALDGQRNMILMSMFGLIMVAAYRHLLRIHHLIFAGVAGMAYFLYIGSIRSDYLDWSSRVKSLSGYRIVDTAWAWFVCYTEPNLHNLNNIIQHETDRAYGLILLSGWVPDSLLSRFVAIPMDASTLLAATRSYAQPGLTFRTIYGDLYMDFGVWGSLIAVGALCCLTVFCFNRAAQSPRSMLGYILLLGGVIWIPALNFMVGIPAVFPVLLFFVLKFTAKAPSHVSVRGGGAKA